MAESFENLEDIFPDWVNEDVEKRLAECFALRWQLFNFSFLAGHTRFPLFLSYLTNQIIAYSCAYVIRKIELSERKNPVIENSAFVTSTK